MRRSVAAERNMTESRPTLSPREAGQSRPQGGRSPSGRKSRKLSTAQILAIGYFGIILFGTFLLALPISSRSGEWTDFFDALLTATSATCVTGLIAVPTAVHWNAFGIIVIILLIQIGGLGFMTFVTLFSFALGRRIGLY